MRGLGLPPSVTATARRISSDRGESLTETVMASKWDLTKAASLKWTGMSMVSPILPIFLAEGMMDLPPPTALRMKMGTGDVNQVSNHPGSVQVGYAGGKVSVSTGGVKKSQKKAR